MNSNQQSTATQIKNHARTLLNSKTNLSLTAILHTPSCQRILGECQFRDRIYTPIKTLFIFIKQVLDADKSCKKAVAGVVAEQFIIENKKISENTGPYTKARKRLP